jgi:hypothetical protein
MDKMPPCRACLVLPILLAAVAPSTAGDPPRPRKVLIFAVDGVRPDALQAADAPNLKALFDGAAYSLTAWAAGGPDMNGPDYSVSGSSYSSMLTGVWCSKHGVCENDFSGSNYDQYPVLFCRLKAARPEAVGESIVRWQPLSPNLIECADVDLAPGSDAAATDEAVRLLRETDPDVLFFHQEDPDTAGHSCGWSPAGDGTFPACYIAAVHTADVRVGAVLAALRARPAFAEEDWLIIALADHGGIAKDHHYKDQIETKRVFMVFNGPHITPGEIVPAPMIVDLAPTTLAYLGVPIDPAWDLDGQVVALAPDPPPHRQRPGDCSQDGTVDISDAICILGHLFLATPAPLPCGESLEGDNVALLDLNGDSETDVSDGVYLLFHLFGGGPGPALGEACTPIGACPDACTE